MYGIRRTETRGFELSTELGPAVAVAVCVRRCLALSLLDRPGFVEATEAGLSAEEEVTRVGLDVHEVLEEFLSPCQQSCVHLAIDELA